MKEVIKKVVSERLNINIVVQKILEKILLRDDKERGENFFRINKVFVIDINVIIEINTVRKILLVSITIENVNISVETNLI